MNSKINLSPDSEMGAVEVAEQEPKRIVKEGFFLEEKELHDAAAGFSFYTIQFQNLSTAQAKLGDAAILNLLNSKLAYDLRIKAKNKLPNPEGASPEAKAAEYQKLRDAGTTLLLTPEEAEAHRPGEREMSSPESMLREAKRLVKEAGKEANPARKLQLEQEAKAMRKKAAALIAAQIGDE